MMNSSYMMHLKHFAIFRWQKRGSLMLIGQSLVDCLVSLLAKNHLKMWKEFILQTVMLRNQDTIKLQCLNEQNSCNTKNCNMLQREPWVRAPFGEIDIRWEHQQSGIHPFPWEPIAFNRSYSCRSARNRSHPTADISAESAWRDVRTVTDCEWNEQYNEWSGCGSGREGGQLCREYRICLSIWKK